MYYRSLRGVYSLLPVAAILIGYGTWFMLSSWIIGPAGRATYLAAQRQLTIATFLRSTPQRWLTNLKFFYTSGQWAIALMSIAYCTFRSRERNLNGIRWLILPMFSVIMLVSFITMSISWPRYIYPALAIASLCVALLIGDLADRVKLHPHLNKLVAILLTLLVVAGLAGPRLIDETLHILTTTHPTAKQFASDLDRVLPMSEQVLNWEWEIEFYSERSFAHPAYQLFPALVDQVYNHYHDPILDKTRIRQISNMW